MIGILDFDHSRYGRPLWGMQLGLFQLSLGILGVLILGLLNRLLIQDIQLPAVLAALALLLMVWAGSDLSITLLWAAVGLFGLSLGVCMNACFTLMFSFVQPGRTGFLLSVWGGVMPITAAWPPSVEAGCSPCSKLGTGVICSLPMAVFLPCRWFVPLVPL